MRNLSPKMIREAKKCLREYGNIAASWLMRKYKLEWEAANEMREMLKAELNWND